MVKSGELYRRFEDFVAQLFRAEGFEVEIEVAAPNVKADFHVVADLLLRSKNNATTVVECKLFRTRQLSAGTLVRIAAQAEAYRRQFQTDRAALVTTAVIPRTSRDTFVEDNPRFVLFDLNALKVITLRHRHLSSQLEDILGEALIDPAQLDDDEDMEPASTEMLNSPVTDISEKPLQPLEHARGRQLCANLLQVRSGRKGAREFEQRVEDALRYVFKADLTAWSSQKVTDSGLSRYDLIARVSSKHDMWRMLRERFQSQYVIFECKNYTEKIKQGEVYTTEKYLFLRALRSVAFIISRGDAHESALMAARGALREHGKLIVNLSIDDICEMLRLRDEIKEYNGYLFDKIDQMLMKLDR
jgi:hypothetical protein